MAVRVVGGREPRAPLPGLPAARGGPRPCGVGERPEVTRGTEWAVQLRADPRPGP